MVFKSLSAIAALLILSACSGSGSSSLVAHSGTNSPIHNIHVSPTWQAHSSKRVQPGPGDLAAFAFATKTSSRTLVTANKPSSNPLLGSHPGETVTAVVSIAGVTGTFIYSGEPSCGNTISNVRLFFTSTGGPFAYTDYWWSDVAPGSATLDSFFITGTQTLTAVLDPTTAWSDWNGQPSSANAAAFTAAASSITSIGLSFGGGCFFENGVGTSDGSGVFTLQSFAD